MKAVATIKKKKITLQYPQISSYTGCAEIGYMFIKVLKKNKCFCVIYVQRLADFLHS